MGFLLQLFVAGLISIPAGIYLILKLFPWIKYDIEAVRLLGKLAITLKRRKRKREFMCDIFEAHVDRNPKKTFLIFQGNNYSYEFMDNQMNKMAQAGLKLGLRQGDIVAMMMTNQPEFIWTAYGMAKIGVEAAFLNFNLRSKSLFHCFKVSDAKAIIVSQDDELVAAIEDIYADIQELGVKVYVHGPRTSEMPSEFISLDEILATSPTTRPSKSLRDGVSFRSPACYVYTSGTTGLPKAATVAHDKVLKGGLLPSFATVTEDDVIYTPLPLYHSAAGLIALGSAMYNGATLVLRPKFSASCFIEDCRKYNVTVIQYIGELCRYLCSSPKTPNDQNHKIRFAIGNGLRRDIWRDFRDRFNIPNIVEFYAATEGNAGFINHFNKFGSVGRSSPFTQLLFPTYFVKYDVARDEPVRGPNGFCVQSGSREPGLMVVKITKDLEFDGYKGNKDLSNKKIIRDVFKKGDAYFNSGDLMEVDDEYFVYFKDRVGDTFRWKGENVSTIEVSNVVADLSWIQDANIFGVEIPGQDGRAGMAAISAVDSHTVTPSNLSDLFQHSTSLLPPYACPRFVRIQSSMTMTATSFKLQKVELMKEGFNPDLCRGDPLYYVDFAAKTYVPVDEEKYKDILAGKIRL